MTKKNNRRRPMNKTCSRIVPFLLILILLGPARALAPLPGYAAESPTVPQRFGDQFSWALETVAERAGRSPALALDALGQPRIACIGYYGAYDYGLLYLRYDNSAWHSEMVDESGSDYASLALDVLGDPHISYYSSADADLLYAHYYGGSWHIQHVETTGDTGEYTSIQVDSTGMPHIAFWDQTNAAVRYTRRVGPTWETATVEVVGGYGNAISLVLDASDHPHITYHNDTEDTLRYAYYDGATWHIETVDDANFAGEHNSLALDAQGHPHIAYYAWGLRYAWHDGSSWHRTILEDDHLTGDYVSLALDSFGRPHISSVTWHYPDEHWLRHAYFDGFDWQHETVDVQTGTAWYGGTSLALDSDDRIHIAYWDMGGSGTDYLQHAVYREPCTPVSGAHVAGPDYVPLGVEAEYAAAHTPPEASTPVLYAWNNGATGATAAYTWALTGSYSVAVTATNACGQAQDALTVEVFCQPLTGAYVAGPPSLLAGQAGRFQAVVEPITASLPLTITWDNGSSGPAASYSWVTTGNFTLTVTATNPCGVEQGASFQVHVLEEWPYAVYLPLLCVR
jgi:hypothetical protein